MHVIHLTLYSGGDRLRLLYFSNNCPLLPGLSIASQDVVFIGGDAVIVVACVEVDTTLGVLGKPCRLLETCSISSMFAIGDGIEFLAAERMGCELATCWRFLSSDILLLLH